MEIEPEIIVFKHLGPVIIDGARYDLEADFSEKGSIYSLLLKAM